MRRLVLSTFALGLLVACEVKGEVTGAFLCTESLECPDGLSCVSGVCTAGANPDGGVGEGPCGTTDMMATSFEGTTQPYWFENEAYIPSGGAVSFPGGEMVMTVPANTNGSRAQFTSYAAYDMRNRSLEFEVTQAAGLVTEVGLLDPSDADIFFGMTEGVMFVYSKGRFLTRGPAYSPVDHRWWRVRDENGMMIWDTSPDRVSWTELGRDSNPLNAAYVQLEMNLQGGANTPASTARWASISPGTDATPRWCKLDNFRENLADGMLAPTTGWYGNGCTATEENGKLKLVGTEHGRQCMIYSTRPVDARDSTLAMEVNVSGYPGGTRIGFADAKYRHYISMHATDRLYINVEANDRDVLNFNRERQDDKKFWRIVFAGTVIRFQNSADGMTWDTITEVNEPGFDASALFIERSMSIEGDGTLPVTSTFGALIR